MNNIVILCWYLLIPLAYRQQYDRCRWIHCSRLYDGKPNFVNFRQLDHVIGVRKIWLKNSLLLSLPLDDVIGDKTNKVLQFLFYWLLLFHFWCLQTKNEPLTFSLKILFPFGLFFPRRTIPWFHCSAKHLVALLLNILVVTCGQCDQKKIAKCL